MEVQMLEGVVGVEVEEVGVGVVSVGSKGDNRSLWGVGNSFRRLVVDGLVSLGTEKNKIYNDKQKWKGLVLRLNSSP